MQNKEMEDNKGEIPHYVNDPVINRLTAPENKLVRPRINYIRAGLNVLIFFAVSLFITYAVAMISQKNNWILFDSFKWNFLAVCLIIFVLCLRFILVWFIHLYQRYAKSETRLRCCFVPSCSEYAVLAIRKYGVVIGGLKTIKRLRRCSPPGGVDYP